MPKLNLPKFFFTKIAFGLALLASNGVSAMAQEEAFELGNGASLAIKDYLIETDSNGYKTLVIQTVPNFDPEPFGEVPSDDYARLARPLCTTVVANSSAVLKEDNVSGVRVRWDFTPSKMPEDMPENMTFTRFHEMVFEIADNAPCIPKPLGVGLDNLTPELSGDLKATLRWAEASKTPGELSLTYAVETGLSEISLSALDRAAIELCILHADILLEARAKYYSQMHSRTVAIILEQDEEQAGFKLMRRVTFAVQNGQCGTGLSPMLTEAIRNK